MVLLPLGQALYYEGGSYVGTDVTARPLISVPHRLGSLTAGFELFTRLQFPADSLLVFMAQNNNWNWILNI